MRRVVVLLALAVLLSGCTRSVDPLGLRLQGAGLGIDLRAGQTVSALLVMLEVPTAGSWTYDGHVVDYVSPPCHWMRI